MQRERQGGRKGSRGRRRSAEGRWSGLAELAGRFARFRREQPRGARVPEELRAAVVAALGQGVAPSELHRACGVSWTQVITWQARHPGERGTSRSAGASQVRVFSVVDEPRDDPAEAPEWMGGRGLELRLGPWTVSVRLAGAGPQGRS